MTVGVAVLPNESAAASADSGLAPPRLAAARAAGLSRLPAGVLVGRFGGAAAQMDACSRPSSASFPAGPYPVMDAAPSADSRPRAPMEDGPDPGAPMARP